MGRGKKTCKGDTGGSHARKKKEKGGEGEETAGFRRYVRHVDSSRLERSGKK